MDQRHVVITGASIAGLSAAFWLCRTGWRVTVLERSPSFRDGGQNVDVRGTAREVLRQMGLFDAVKAANTTETGTVLVDDHGAVVAELPTDDSDGATAELEVLRGDLARVLLDALPDGVEVHYDESVTFVDGDVSIATTSGRRIEADLLVIAEGVRSTTRDLLFAGDVERHELGVTMAFGTIPRVEDDDRRWRWFTTTGGRQVHLRPDNHGTTRAILACTGDDLTAMDFPEALDELRSRFAGAGWQTERVLAGFAESDDVYLDYLTQIVMSSYHRGRVCLLGDAAWCVTPMGGGGASLALIGGYVLAAYLSTCADVDTALDAYERWMHPMAEQAQRMPPGVTKLAYPQTGLGLTVHDLAMKAMTSGPLAALGSQIGHVARADRPLPSIAP